MVQTWSRVMKMLFAALALAALIAVPTFTRPRTRRRYPRPARRSGLTATDAYSCEVDRASDELGPLPPS